MVSFIVLIVIRINMLNVVLSVVSCCLKVVFCIMSKFGIKNVLVVIVVMNFWWCEFFWFMVVYVIVLSVMEDILLSNVSFVWSLLLEGSILFWMILIFIKSVLIVVVVNVYW